MAKKDINVFNVSFLDLLSGALGAVLILFVIVPKLDSTIRQQLQELETFKSLKLNVEDINEMMDQLKGSVPKEMMSSLKSSVNNLETDISSLSGQVQTLQQQLAKSEEERTKSIEKSKKLEEEIETIRSQMKDSNKMVVDNKKLKSELDVLKKSAEQAQAQLEVLKLQQNNESAAQAKINKQLEEQNKELIKCLESKKKLEDALAEMRAKIEELVTKNKELSKELSKNSSDKDYVEEAVEKLVKKIEALQEENKKIKTKSDKIMARNEQLETQLKKAQNELAKKDKNESGGTKIDRTGVRFSDKNIVFIVDVSGSMDDDPEPEKLEQVKAGLKMLVASMDDTYNIDIVIFPKSPQQDYDALYNRLSPVTDKQKYAIYRHLAPIYARNCTPTRSVLEHVLTSDAYKDAGTITFLSDGLPTKSVAGSTDCPDDPPREVLSYVRSINKGKVINTIGVGKVYRNSASSDPKVKFMKELAKQNGGFYIGF